MSQHNRYNGRSNELELPSGFANLAEIEGAKTVWLWDERIPVGHVTVLAGEGSSGKTLLAAEIAARVSNDAGQSTGGDKPAGTVVIAHAHGHENSVLKNRLLAAGADPSRVVVVNPDVRDLDAEFGGADDGDEMSPAEQLLCKLEGTLIQLPGASLVVIDHLLGWLGQTRLKPEEMTDLFDKLTAMAARYGVALVVLWRLEKGGRAAQNRALEALLAAAPVVWLLAADFYDARVRLAVCAQNRLGRQSENLAFRVEDDRVVFQPAPQWMSADDLMATRTADRHERRQAGQWLLNLLSQGPIEAQRLWEEVKRCGLAERTVRRAAAELDLHPTKDGKSGIWYWGVRSETVATAIVIAPAMPEVAAVENVAALPLAGSLADAPVVRVEMRPDASPNVAALPQDGGVADSDAIAPAAPATVGDGDASERTAGLSGGQRRRQRRRERRARARGV